MYRNKPASALKALSRALPPPPGKRSGRYRALPNTPRTLRRPPFPSPPPLHAPTHRPPPPPPPLLSLALPCTTGAACTGAQDDAPGFTEGSSLSLLNRMLFEQLDY